VLSKVQDPPACGGVCGAGGGLSGRVRSVPTGFPGVLCSQQRGTARRTAAQPWRCEMAYDDEWVLTYQDEWVLTYQAVQTLHAAVTVLRLSRLGAVLHADAAAWNGCSPRAGRGPCGRGRRGAASR